VINVKYTGKRSAVSVSLPSGRKLLVAHGEIIRVSDPDAKSLTSMPGWRRVTVPTVSKESDEF